MVNLTKLTNRVKNIIIIPKQEWVKIKSEKTDAKEILLNYVLLLVIPAAITRFIGYQLFYSYASVSLGIKTTLIYLITPLVGVMLTSYVTYFLAEQFQSNKNINKSFQLVGYAYTPSLLAAIIANLSPIYLSWVGIFGLYSLYLFWVGLPEILETPKDKKVPFVLVSFVVLIVINIALAWMLSGVFYAF